MRNEKWKMILGLLMQPAHYSFVTRRRYSQQRIATLCDPAIENPADRGERPNGKCRRQPAPARQHPDDFHPGEVPFGPATIRRACMHLGGHLFARVRRSAFQDLRVVVIEPLYASVPIQRIDTLAHPAAEVALTVIVDFDFVALTHETKLSRELLSCAISTIQ